MERTIITINEDKCNGCGLCITGCPEGALQIIGGKARLVSDLYCDGLGACIGTCPQEAITTFVREAEPYNEWRVMDNIAKQGSGTIKAHLRHLVEHGEHELYSQALEYLKVNDMPIPEINPPKPQKPEFGGVQLETTSFSTPLALLGEQEESNGSNWPLKIDLLPPFTSNFREKKLVLGADCALGAYRSFHQDFKTGANLLIGCPKFGNANRYLEKLANLFEVDTPSQIDIVVMTVPCCSGLEEIVRKALIKARTNTSVPTNVIHITPDGQIVKD